MNNRSFIEYIKDCTLPGVMAHKEMSFSNRPFKKPVGAMLSAVSLILFEEKGEWMFPLIKRTESGSHHKGQIALPGGKLDEGEDISQCVVREAHEEMGIGIDAVQTIRVLTEVYIPVSNYLVYPVVCVLSENPKFAINKAEVEKVIICGVRDLLHFEKRHAYVQMTDGSWIKVPAFEYKGNIIWGATALMMNEFKHIVHRYCSKSSI